MGIADTVGDGFSYTIVPGKTVRDIPRLHAKTIIRSIVRLYDVKEDQSSSVREKDNGTYDFLTSKGVSLPESDLSEEAI